MIVHIPTPLRSYTAERSQVEATGATLGAVLADLDRQFPGMRFRMIDEHGRVRPHIKLFLGEEVTEDLGRSVEGVGVVHVICALTGG